MCRGVEIGVVRMEQAISEMTIHAARDAVDIMGCRHVLITRMDISGGGDDAVKCGPRAALVNTTADRVFLLQNTQ